MINLEQISFSEFLPFFVVGGISWLLLSFLGDIARKIDLVDHPTKRKRHELSVPLIGGISIFIAFSLALLLAPFGLGEYRYLLFGMGVIVIVGVLDDHQDVPPFAKIVAQFFASFILVLSGTIVTGVGDIFSWEDGNHQGLGLLASPLTAIAIVGLINAYNFIDGIDGLAATLFSCTCVVMVGICSANGLWKDQYFLLLFLTGVFVFLCFNTSIFVHPSKLVFLGDAGSMLLGLVLVFFLIDLSELREDGSLRTTVAPWLVGLPLFDMFSVIGLRLISQSPVARPDRLHLHHVLEDFGLSKSKVFAILTVVHLSFMSFGLIGQYMGLKDPVLFWSLFPVILVYATVVYSIQIRDR